MILQTPMDAGPAKMRRRGAKPATLNVGFFMTTDQVETLETFVTSTLRGTKRFEFPHPRLGTNVEVRIVPGQDGQLYQTAYSTPGEFTVDMKLEVLP